MRNALPAAIAVTMLLVACGDGDTGISPEDQRAHVKLAQADLVQLAKAPQGLLELVEAKPSGETEKAYTVAATFKTKSKLEWPKIHLFYGVYQPKKGEMVGTGHGFCVVPGPIEAGKTFEVQLSVDRAGLHGERIVVIEQVTPKSTDELY